MAAASLTDYDPVHRQLWPDQRVLDESVRGAPFLGMVRRSTDLGYDVKHIALQYSRPQGRSRDFATAQSRVTGSKYTSFGIQSVDDYGVGQVDGKLLRSSRNPSQAMIVDVFERETMSAMRQIRRSLHIGAWNDGSGSRGRIAQNGLAEAGGDTTVTLDVPADAKNFEVGMYVTAAATATGSLRDSGAAYEVIAVDLQAGTITLDGTAQTTSSWSEASDPSDFLFVDGDAQDGGSTTLPGVMLSGVPAWIPTTAPTSGDDFFGVDRSVDVVRHAGWRFTASGLSTTTIYATIMKACSGMSRAGEIDLPETAFLNGEDFGELLDDLDTTSAQGETIQRAANDVAGVYYSGVRIQTAIGPVEVFQDFQVPKGRCYLLNMDSWTLHSIGEAPQFIEEDGTRLLRSGSADAFEFRLCYHAQLACDAPLFNAVVTLPS
jgi:hypothetical protein